MNSTGEPQGTPTLTFRSRSIYRNGLVGVGFVVIPEVAIAIYIMFFALRWEFIAAFALSCLVNWLWSFQWRINLTARVIFSDHGVQLVNHPIRDSYAWGDIDRFTLASPPQDSSVSRFQPRRAQLLLKNGTSVEVDGIESPLPNQTGRYTEAQQLVDEMNKMIRNVQATGAFRNSIDS